MAFTKNEILEKVYKARSAEDKRQAYNNWAVSYDADVKDFGIQLPYVGAAIFSQFVPLSQTPILDAGCGTAMHTIPLKLAGYEGFHGIDISDGMLEIAGSHGVYDGLQRMTLGEPLDFATDLFAATYCIGAMGPGHAPPECLEEFIRVTCSGGEIVFSTHSTESELALPYHDCRANLSEQGLWKQVYETSAFISMPKGDSKIKHVIYVYEVM